MNTVGAPADAASVIAAQVQQLSNKSRSAQKAQSDGARRFQDSVELRVAGVESVDAVRAADSEPHPDEQQRKNKTPPETSPDPAGAPTEQKPKLDLKA